MLGLAREGKKIKPMAGTIKAKAVFTCNHNHDNDDDDRLMTSGDDDDDDDDDGGDVDLYIIGAVCGSQK